jgi:hypothetical protein
MGVTGGAGYIGSHMVLGEARWNEINLQQAMLTVPLERFKSDATHVVPLVDDALAIVANLPRWKGGNFIFSTREGKLPVDGWSKAKERLDRLMADRRTTSSWVFHSGATRLRSRAKSGYTLTKSTVGHSRRRNSFRSSLRRGRLLVLGENT